MEIDKSSAVAVMGRGICLASSFFTKPPKANYFATGEARRVEFEIGEMVEMACAGYLTYRWSLIRKPPGSSARIDEARLVGVNVPGVHAIRVETNGGWSRYLELCAYTHAQMYGIAPPSEIQRLNERSWLNQPGRETDEVVRRLEQ
jgi:hypothetical protein